MISHRVENMPPSRNLRLKHGRPKEGSATEFWQPKLASLGMNERKKVHIDEDQTVNGVNSFSKTHLISLAPLPDARGLHTKEGKRVLADNNQPNHHQFEHREEGSYVPTGKREGDIECTSFIHCKEQNCMAAVTPMLLQLKTRLWVNPTRGSFCSPRSNSLVCSLENHLEASPETPSL